MQLKDPKPRHPKVQKLLDAHEGPGGDAGRWLAELVRATVKDSVEDIYHTMPTWAPADGQFFAHLSVYSKHANLGFSRGTGLVDPDGLLEGGGKTYRFVRVERPNAVPKTKLVKLIKQASAIAREADP